MINDPWFYVFGSLAVMIAGISKGGFGGGIGVMAVPLMSLVIPPFQAAAIMLPMLCVMDLAGLKAFWRKWDNHNLRIMLPGAVMGIVIGLLTYRWVSDGHLRAVAKNKDIRNTRVSEILTPNLECCEVDADANDAAKLMSEKQVRRLPVLDQSKNLVGVVSIGDLEQRLEHKIAGAVLAGVTAESRSQA